MNWIYILPNWILWSIAVVSLIISLISYLNQKNTFIQLIDKLPGPPNVFGFGHMIPFLFSPKEKWFRLGMHFITKFSRKQPLVRFWAGRTPRVFILDISAIETILNSSRLLDKSVTYDFLRPWLGDGLLTSTGSKWRSRRKLITPSFHFRILEDFFKVFVEQTEVLVNILENIKDKDYFDVYPYLTRCTLDIICETAMGKRVHAQSDTTSEYVQAVNNMADIFGHRAMLPFLAPDWIFNLTYYGGLQKKSLKMLHGFTNQVIQEKWEELQRNENKISSSEDKNEDIGQKRRLAFLDMLLEIYRDSKMLNFGDIREEVDTFMFEGHDTTAAGLAWVLYNIGRFPEVQQTLHQEIDEVFGDSKRVISKEDLPLLKYMELVIKESLRLFPPVPFYGRKTVDTINLCGYTIPAGVEIAFNIFMLHRNEKHFPDPGKFDPNRFLPENCVDRHPFAYIPFSAGPRNCIGQKFAMMEIKTTICQILRHFKVTSKHRFEEIIIIPQLVLRPSNGIWIKMEKRN